MSAGMNGAPPKDPRNALFDNFFKRMEQKKLEDARQEAELAAATLQQRTKEALEEIEDDGAEDFTIGNRDGKVLMVFPHSVDWLGWSPEEAIIVAAALTEHAAAAARWKPPAEAPAQPPEGEPDGHG